MTIDQSSPSSLATEAVPATEYISQANALIAVICALESNPARAMNLLVVTCVRLIDISALPDMRQSVAEGLARAIVANFSQEGLAARSKPSRDSH